MPRDVSKRIVFWITLASVAIVLAALARPTISQEKGAPPRPAKAAKAKKPRGRLPAYYRYVVTPQQREAIYKIQAEFAPKIAELQAQLKALTKERDQKVSAVLTPEQRKKVEDLRGAAKAKRAQKTKKPARKQPTTETPKAD